ncbi:hypothetical protein phiK7A1_015c [Pseudomonas phage phiK7A1]|uniref:Uncharacterized protein n=1 Tax=Pseudomonas phage phiK7A1 TaxID=2759194 RepID=A0A7H0XFL5_9CAUD|nr:hypothetical protein phiK7A1_015c [Pseudomonas phage phiK7A1]
MTGLVVFGFVVIYLMIGAFITGLADCENDSIFFGILMWPLLLLVIIGAGFFAVGQKLGKLFE